MSLIFPEELEQELENLPPQFWKSAIAQPKPMILCGNTGAEWYLLPKTHEMMVLMDGVDFIVDMKSSKTETIREAVNRYIEYLVLVDMGEIQT